MNLSLDIAVDIYPISKDQNLTVQLASSLHKDSKSKSNKDAMNLDGEDTDGMKEINNVEQDSWRFDRQGNAGVADEFDYVMYGKVSDESLSRSIKSRSSQTNELARRRKDRLAQDLSFDFCS